MIRAVTFDIYSASCDIEGSGIPATRAVLGLSEERGAAFFRHWRTQQWNYLLLNNSMENGFESYRYITAAVLEQTAKKTGLELSGSQKRKLMEIWTAFKAWPEAKEVIDELKRRGYRVAMLSNGDRDMLEPLQSSTGIDFDAVFSGDQASCYKPCPNIYWNALVRLGCSKEEHLHVAGSKFDVMGAVAAGMKCAWSNRHGDVMLDQRYSPNYEMASLEGLLEILPDLTDIKE